MKNMKKIQILGTGCLKCAELYKHAKQAATQSGIEFQIEKISDINKIIELGVMMTPALVIDGKVATSGSVPSVEEISAMLSGKGENPA